MERQSSGLGTVYRDAAVARILGPRGHAVDARALLTEARAMGVGEIDADVGAFVQLVVAELAVEDGDLEAAGNAVTAGLAHLGASDDVVLVGPLCAVGIRAAADRAERARALRRPVDIANAVAAGTAAMERAEALWASAPPRPGSATATRLLCAAEMARLAESSDPVAWTELADAWTAIPMPAPEAYARYRAAEAHLINGDRVAAEAALRAAHATAAGLGAVALLASIEGLARRARLALPAVTAAADVSASPDDTEADDGTGAVVVAGGSAGRGGAARPKAPPPTAAPATPFAELGLSAREAEVLALVAAGRTNGQIAQELFISPKTASVHVTHILDKLGVSSRIEAAMLAARAGLIAPDAEDSS
jgi:DNA-binding CsgD family transcriptional regulator